MSKKIKNPRGTAGWQWSITRVAKAKRWSTDPRIVFDVKTCLRLIKTFDAGRFASIARTGVSDGELLAAYCTAAGIVKNKRGPTSDRPVTKHRFRPSAEAAYVMSDDFLASYEWRRIRMQVLKRDGAICACCGATRADGVKMHVDHIKPRRIFPALALDADNLQVLCEVCNHGKGNWDMTDWRGSAAKPDADPADEFHRRFTAVTK